MLIVVKAGRLKSHIHADYTDFYPTKRGWLNCLPQVALVNCQTSQKGVYKAADGKELPALVEDCEVTLIDRSKDSVIFKK